MSAPGLPPDAIALHLGAIVGPTTAHLTTGILWTMFFMPITLLAVIALFLRPLYGVTAPF